MTNLVAFPVLLPMLTGTLLLFLHGQVRLQRVVSLLSGFAAIVLSGYLGSVVWLHGIQVVQAGGWAAPYGITFAADLFAVLMLLLSSVSLFTILMYAREVDSQRQRIFFYPVLQFLITGINLSFLTGDFFNLFVAFEVMLISSYFLVTLGGRPGQLREGFKYLVINILASTLFLISIGLLYGKTGTLNMADLAQQIGEGGGDPVLTVAAISFMVVFGVKGAVFPLYFWLPGTYFRAPTAVTALFAAVLTKVGVYALVRVFTLVFIHDVGYTHGILLVAAGFGMLLGVLGAFSQLDFKSILAYHSISQVGYMVMGLGLFSSLSLAGTLYFLAHHSVVKSSLFLMAGIVERVTGSTSLKRYDGVLASHPGLAFLFLATGLSLAGMPPFSGFFGKLILVQAGIQEGAWLIVTVSLVVGLFTLASMIKIYRKGFWGESAGERRELGALRYGQLMAAAGLLLTISVAMGLGAAPVMEFVLAASDELLNPELYIAAVLGR
jgi:multicomponent Na+:H+ antiporter subunit D